MHRARLPNETMRGSTKYKKAVLVHKTPREAKAAYIRVIGCESLIKV